MLHRTNGKEADDAPLLEPTPEGRAIRDACGACATLARKWRGEVASNLTKPERLFEELRAIMRHANCPPHIIDSYVRAILRMVLLER